MGMLSKIASGIFIIGVFYTGTEFNEWRNKPLIEHLQRQNNLQGTLDYQIAFLSVEMANNPNKVKQAFKEYEFLLQNPELLEKKLEQYNIQIE